MKKIISESSTFNHGQKTREHINITINPKSRNTQKRNPKAIIYCEANFGKTDGKTANGLIRQSDKYQILSVIDSEKAGLDSGVVLNDAPNGIPICNSLKDSLTLAGFIPDYLILGMAPSSGMLSKKERSLVLHAIELGINIVSGLHEFLTDDPEFSTACKVNNVHILDIRKPKLKKDLRMFSGEIFDVSCPRIAVLGTDCAIGKRTTSSILVKALNAHGLKSVLVSTGQTGIIQGNRYGVALDAIPSQFCAGELEASVIEAFKGEKPDVIIIEGQGALSHPAFSTTSFILRGSCPDAVVLQHAPGRSHRCDFEKMAMPTPVTEINLIQTFSDTKVIGLTINHENMTDTEVSTAIVEYENELNLPVTDPLTRSSDYLVHMILDAFPQLKSKINLSIQ